MRMAPHQWIQCLGQKENELDCVSRYAKSRSCQPLLAEEKHSAFLSRSLTPAGLPSTPAFSKWASALTTWTLLWDHVEAVTLYTEPRHQIQGWVNGASPLRDLSLLWKARPSHLCYFTAPHGISAQKKEELWKLYQRLCTKPNLWCSILFFFDMLELDPCHIMATRSTSLKDKGETKMTVSKFTFVSLT